MLEDQPGAMLSTWKLVRSVGAPAQCERGRHGGVDLLLVSIEPDRLIGDVAVAVARVADLDVMPGILRPVSHIACGVGLYPVIDWRCGRTRIFGVIPGAVPAIALEAKDDGFPVRPSWFISISTLAMEPEELVR